MKFHYRGKGVDQRKLTCDLFNKMAAGQCITLLRDFAFKKVNYKLNKKQQSRGIDQFSIVKLNAIDTSRTLNRKAWAGRQWIGDKSIPVF